MKNYIDQNIEKYNIRYDYNKYLKNQTEDKFINCTNQKNKYDLDNKGLEFLKGNIKEKNEQNKINNNDIQRLNILLENSQNNEKYNEIIKQRKMIINSN